MESTCAEYPEVVTTCGRNGCVVIYTGDNCAFCDTAFETLRDVLSDFGLSSSVISEVNVTSGIQCACDIPGIVTLPTIRVCDQLITGLPQIDEARSSIMHAILKGCFPI
ncbi:MAG: hypothetical protein KAR33_03305 [Candidatus Thorarchaeota archaeon]|nr:hypothetical protein [Candidatus Thorarchaeota archaeon]